MHLNMHSLSILSQVSPKLLNWSRKSMIPTKSLIIDSYGCILPCLVALLLFFHIDHFIVVMLIFCNFILMTFHINSLLILSIYFSIDYITASTCPDDTCTLWNPYLHNPICHISISISITLAFFTPPKKFYWVIFLLLLLFRILMLQNKMFFS